MSYFDDNLEILKDKRKEIYDLLIKIIKEHKLDFSKFRLLDTRNGEKTVEIYDGELWIRLNSLYNPELEADRWVKKFEFKNLDEPLLMFGIANGIFARAMLKKLGETSLAILVEPDISLFIFCLNNFYMGDILSDPRVWIFIDSINFEKFSAFLDDNILDNMLNDQIVCSYPLMDKLYSEKALEFKRTIENRFYEREMQLITANLLADSEMRNTLDNLHFIEESNYVEDLIGLIPKDIPFFIIAAGPSLDKNIDELKKAEGKAFILALDTSVRTLLAHNIKFDAIITVDATKPVEYLNSESCLNYPILSGITANNKILELNKGKKIFLLNTSHFLISLYSKYKVKMNNYSLGSCVATSAFSVAKTLGVKKIVLVGQDLAYCGNATHVGNVNDNSENNRGIDYVEGIYGKQVKTRVDWLFYLRWFEDNIKVLKSDIEVIDATEGGAKIHGATIMKLSEVIDKYCDKEYNFKIAINNLLPTFREERYLEIVHDLHHMEDEISIIEDYVKRGIEACEEIIKVSKKNDRNVKKEREYGKLIHNINETIEKQLVYNIINDYIKKDINMAMRTVNSISDDEYEDFKYTCELSKFVYKKIMEAIEIIKPKLHESLKRL